MVVGSSLLTKVSAPWRQGGWDGEHRPPPAASATNMVAEQKPGDLVKALPAEPFSGEDHTRWEEWKEELMCGLELCSAGSILKLLRGEPVEDAAYHGRLVYALLRRGTKGKAQATVVAVQDMQGLKAWQDLEARFGSARTRLGDVSAVLEFQWEQHVGDVDTAVMNFRRGLERFPLPDQVVRLLLIRGMSRLGEEGLANSLTTGPDSTLAETFDTISRYLTLTEAQRTPQRVQQASKGKGKGWQESKGGKGWGKKGGKGGQPVAHSGGKGQGSTKGKCRCCGSTEHSKPQCPHKEKGCSKCGKKGHIESTCWSERRAQAVDGTQAEPESTGGTHPSEVWSFVVESDCLQERWLHMVGDHSASSSAPGQNTSARVEQIRSQIREMLRDMMERTVRVEMEGLMGENPAVDDSTRKRLNRAASECRKSTDALVASMQKWEEAYREVLRQQTRGPARTNTNSDSADLTRKLSSGKHKGKTIGWVLQNDHGYCQWITDHFVSDPGLVILRRLAIERGLAVDKDAQEPEPAPGTNADQTQDAQLPLVGQVALGDFVGSVASGERVEFLVDSGADVNLLPVDLARRLQLRLRPHQGSLQVANGSSVAVAGRVDVEVVADCGRVILLRALVAPVTRPLLSTRDITRKGFHVRLGSESWIGLGEDKVLLAKDGAGRDVFRGQIRIPQVQQVSGKTLKQEIVKLQQKVTRLERELREAGVSPGVQGTPGPSMPPMPSPEAVAKHCLTHLPYESFCSH